MDYSIEDILYTEKNIDRCRFYTNSEENMKSVLVASYHLENNVKSGGLELFNIIDNKFNSQAKLNVNYGVLEYITVNNGQLILTCNSANSSTLIKMNKFDKENVDQTFEILKLIDFSLESKEETITCNVTENLTDSKFVYGFSNGEIVLYDIHTMNKINSYKGHEYSIWGLCKENENSFYTGSEDNFLKVWDYRDDSLQS